MVAMVSKVTSKTYSLLADINYKFAAIEAMSMILQLTNDT